MRTGHSARAFAVAETEIDLASLRHNLAMVTHVARRPALCVVKADGYGHGAELVAGALDTEPGCAGFVVSRIEEALALRERGAVKPRTSRPLLCLGTFLASQSAAARSETIRALNEASVSMVLGSSDDVGSLLADAEQEPTLISGIEAVHLAVDTGLRREGLAVEEVRDAKMALEAAGIPIGSVFSHFVEAEVFGSRVSVGQRERFLGLSEKLRSNTATGPMMHLANSAGALTSATLPRQSPDAVVRVGGALYGLVDLPPEHVPDLRPVMSVRSRLVQVRTVEVGDSVGYNQQFTAERPSVIGLVALGYADGLPTHPAPLLWIPSNGDQFSSTAQSGHRVPVVGKVSMDLATVDLTKVAASGQVPPCAGDEIVALGVARSRSLPAIRAGDHAELNHCSPYAISVAFGRRNPVRVRES